MNTLDKLFVRRGDPVTADRWNALVNLVKAARIIKSRDVLPFETPGGTIINLRKLGDYTHPWQVTEGAGEVTVAPGTINGMDPFVGFSRDKLSALPPTPLPIDSGGFDGDGKGWVAIEVQYDEVYAAITEARIVHVANLGRDSQETAVNPRFYIGIPGLEGRRARYPLARVLKRGENFEVRQIAYFNLQTKPRHVGDFTKVIPRHFFWPV